MMRNQWALELHLILLSTFMVATICLGAQNSTTRCHERERLALLKFKYSVKDDFKMLSSWVGTDCCSWDRVRCDGATGRVVGLHLRGVVRGLSVSCWVTGTFSATASGIDGYLVGEEYYLIGEDVSSSLAELRHLKYLDLSGNDFQRRRIPEFIGSLKKLSYLNLSNAGFSGNIPHHIGNLSNLRVLALSTLSSPPYTETLTIDDMVWISGLSSLEYLDLNGVNLSGAKNRDMVLYMIPSVTHLSLSCSGFSNVDLAGPFLNVSRILPNIKYLQLKDNAIEGRFPSVLTNMTSLLSLDLSGNILNSSIPFMPSLLKLDLSNNNHRLIDHIGIWRQCNLKELTVSSSNLEGELTGPSKNASVCSRYGLEMLDLSSNELSGLIPKSLGRLAGLRALHLASNRLIGRIPEDLGRLRFLEALDLSYNQLDGPIPTFLGQLTEIDLSYNLLNCSIPESIGSVASLTHINIEFNQLAGPIPASLGRLAILETFLASSNLLNGTIPVLVGQLTNLNSLDLSNNSLEGVVSESHFSNLSMLEHLDLSLNRNLTLKVSREWISPFQLRTVWLRSCKIIDGFPQWLQTHRKLEELVLSNASLHGLLPTWLQKMAAIDYLDLSENKLGGTLINIPFSKHIGVLFLQDNLFNGSIPRSLCRGTRLAYFDVSNNRLSGNIPDCVENLQMMRAFKLSSNRLSGALSSSLGYFSSLRWLRLNDNNFGGKLPQDLGNLKSLKVLDLGNNQFTGNIPQRIGENLTDLVVLRLHKNYFTGRIPQSLCKCSNLQILDVAHNNLTGSIPLCIGKLNGMIKASEQYLDYGDGSDETLFQVMKGTELEYTKTLSLVFNMDLSSNKLTGQIPSEITTLILLVGLNLSHNHLNGSIPDSIGNMKALNSLDFSNNHLTGTIPPSMAALNFLSLLNLSHNNLSGRIPTGNQLQTLNDPSMYAGNRDLCGAPLPTNCSNHENPPTTNKKNEDADQLKNFWFYADIMCGFATGLWGIIGVLLFKKQWRRKLFLIAEVAMDKVIVAVAVKVSKIKRGREAK